MQNNNLIYHCDSKKSSFVSLFITFFIITIAGVSIIFALLNMKATQGSINIYDLVTIGSVGILLLALSVFILIVIFSLPHLKYELGEDALYISMGPWKEEIPYSEITDVTVKNLVMNPLSSFRMPGVALFDVYYLDEGRVRMYSTHALYDVVLIKTKTKKYGISPENEESFVTALRSRISHLKETKRTKPVEWDFKNRKAKTAKIIVWLTIVASFIIGIYFYFRLPPKIAVHWDSSGNANGYLPKFIGVFLSPLLFILIGLLPIFTSFGKTSEKFYIELKSKYYLSALVLIGILLFAYIYMLLWNIGTKLNFRIFSLTMNILIIAFIAFSLALFVPKHKAENR